MNVETLYVLRLKKPGNLSCLALKFERLIYDYVPAIQHAHIPHSTMTPAVHPVDLNLGDFSYAA